MSNLNRNLSVLIRMKNYYNKIDETLNRFNKDYKIFNDIINTLYIQKLNSNNAQQQSTTNYGPTKALKF